MDRVTYREQLVQDMEEIVGVLRAEYDLVIVGMRHRVNSVVTEGGLMDWSDCPELGVVGDFLASPDFSGKFTILVVKQQDQSDADSYVPDVDETIVGGLSTLATVPSDYIVLQILHYPVSRAWFQLRTKTIMILRIFCMVCQDDVLGY
ncbi:hypothetical protein J5N97_002185 [Dioscorea zingiberensis]|uniref:Cation/H(+) antiporter C-terminal domain-containing protein n=1 Tax=Dioscorea zingiberensis TaxID=325984 RepID=A0A9D5D3B8_9LILI|nr:hypothetical protein J5N97_002185 [Dioscorea zingiberensis]